MKINTNFVCSSVWVWKVFIISTCDLPFVRKINTIYVTVFYVWLYLFPIFFFFLLSIDLLSFFVFYLKNIFSLQLVCKSFVFFFFFCLFVWFYLNKKKFKVLDKLNTKSIIYTRHQKWVNTIEINHFLSLGGK